MKKLKDESGQSLVITALCMTCLLGFVALAADMGVMMRGKRLVQTAADSAAVAGALELNYNPGGVTSAALAAAGQNGYTAASSGVTTSGGTTVTVNTPPASGPHSGAGNTNYVEVIVSQVQPTIFMGIFGRSSQTVLARAVAKNGGSSNGCVYILNPTAGNTMDMQGNFDLNAPNCGIIIDSTASNALDFTGKAGTITAGYLGVVGGVSGSSSGTQPVSPVVAQSDPLAYLIASMPDPTVNPLKATCTTPPGGTLTGTVSPGGGVVCYNGTVTISNATLNAGTYVFTGDVILDGNVTTNGATLDLNSGGLSENSGTVLSLLAPAPTSGSTFQGIAIMAPPTNASQLAFSKGDATGTIEGIIYAPGAFMTLQDHGGSGKKGGLNLITDLIVNQLKDTAALITITSYSLTVPGSPLSTITLVE
jgi:hypothetical protein